MFKPYLFKMKLHLCFYTALIYSLSTYRQLSFVFVHKHSQQESFTDTTPSPIFFNFVHRLNFLTNITFLMMALVPSSHKEAPNLVDPTY